MTMPSERTRALRWGGEFLNELLAADNIGADLKAAGTDIAFISGQVSSQLQLAPFFTAVSLRRIKPQPPTNLQSGCTLIHGVEVQGWRAPHFERFAHLGYYVQSKRPD